MKKIFLLVLLFCLKQADAQIISTVAGNGTQGYTGDGGQATAAEINKPNEVAFDAAGNLFIADFYNHLVRKVTTAGIISTVAGTGTGGFTGDGGQATAAELNYAAAVYVDASNNLFIADFSNARIRKVNTAGIITTVAGGGSVLGDGGQATAAKLTAASDVVLDKSGNIYIADGSGCRIRKVNTSGIITTIAGNGTAGYGGDGAAATAAKLNNPTGVAVDYIGNVYIADYTNNRVRKVTTAGIISTIAGNGTLADNGDGGQATSAQLANPNGLTTDAMGNIYIADGGNYIRKINSAGIISTLAGTGTGTYSGDGGQATAATLNHPTGVALDATGNVYVSDELNNRVRMITCVVPTLTLTSNSYTMCSGSSQTLSVTGASSYTWSPALTLTNAYTASTIASPTNTTIYSVVGTSAGGCSSINSPVTVTVTVNALPNVSFSVTNACNGNAVDFTNTTSNQASITSWQWNFGDGSTSAAVSPTHIYATCGIYTVSLTATNNLNCTKTVSTTDTVYCLPITVAPPSFTVCPGTQVTGAQTTFAVTGAYPQLGIPQTIYFVNNGHPSTKTHGGIPLADTLGYNAIPSYNAIAQNLNCGLLVDTIYGLAISTNNGTNSCTGNMATFTISVYPTPMVTGINDITACNNNTVPAINFSGCPANQTYNWTNSNTTIGLAASGTGNIPSFPGQDPNNTPNIGVINVTSTANGCTGPASVFSITINPTPSISVTSPSPYCPGNLISSTDYNITTNPVSGVTYSWTVNNTSVGLSATGTGAAPNTAYSAPANSTLNNLTGIVSYTPELNGCIGSVATETIIIKPTPYVQAIPNQYWCPGSNTSAVTFSTQPASASSTYNWTYDNLGGIPSTGSTNPFPSFPTSNPGLTTLTTTVTVAATLNNCPGPNSTFFISVYPNPVAKFSKNNSVPACYGQPINFADHSSPNSGNITVNQWAWDMNNDGLPDANTQNPSYTLGGVGSTPVTLQVSTNTAPSCTAQVTEQIYVSPLPSPDFTGDTLSGCSILHTHFTDLSNITSGTITQWYWDFGNGNTSTSMQPQIQSFANNSTTYAAYYSILLTAKSDSGCSNTKIKPNYIDVLACATNGIQSFYANAPQVNLYPNPNNGSFVVEPANNIEHTIYVYDVNGKLVLSQTINSTTTINANNLNDGVYNVNIINSEGVVNKRLVIVR